MNTQIMSDIEAIVYDWLVKRSIEFTFQSSMMGGRYELGGAIADFRLDELYIILRVQGDYFHTQINKQATDSVQRELLESQGWTVVDIWGSDLETPAEVNSTLEKALLGEEVL
uniref:DUF559 domain-containing protein n=1 Tax=viral metagenome TaxID=1070528 RepID=A0A6M3K6A0_9ZZZZ